MFTSNWILADLVRTALDRTAKHGVLAVQDDLGEPSLPDDELPFDRLTRRLGELGCQLYDHRQTPRAKGSRGEAKGTRQLAKVTALWWHQTACVFTQVQRTLGVPAHIMIMRNGDVVLLHPLRAYCYHGHAANSFSVGVEVMCRAAGTEGVERTFWRSRAEKANGLTMAQLAAEPTDKQLAVVELVADYVTTEVARQAEEERKTGAKVPGIVAQGFHRNSHSSRTSDPGSRIAQTVKHVAADYGHEYGGPVVGSGNPIPESWR